MDVPTVLSLSSAQMTDTPVDARQLFSSAWQCLGALRELINARVGNAPKGILAGHAIEAALKSYLAFRGWKDKELRKLNHDLIAAWKAARAEGLDILPAPPRWLNGLSFNHDELRYRYPDARAEFWMPRVDVYLDTIEDLVEAVKQHFPDPPESESWW